MLQKEGKIAQVERKGWRRFFRRFLILAAGILVFFAGVFLFFNLPGQSIRQDVITGITFSNRQAEALGLDWRQTYLALLDDMGVQEIRIPVYWDLVEKESGAYNWEDVDWQLAEAKKRDAHIILTVGQRVPRWPECHIPSWAKENDALRKERLLVFVEQTIRRYKDHPEIEMWQVENEAFLPFFGICPKLDVATLDQEIALVHSLDPTRKILMSDSGELSLWISAARRGDVFGTTMYRDIYKEEIGYYRYPIGPNFFRFKEWVVRLFTEQEEFYVIELQGEPWGPGWIGHMALQEQFKTMNEAQLRDTFTYAQRVGFPRIYFWGAEWWYWLKEKQASPAVWEEAKKIFEEYGTREKDFVDVSLGNGKVHARVADDETERRRGLSGTEVLPDDEGMLFVFSFRGKHGFWMKDMKYSIDVLWMDVGGRVVDIQTCLDPASYPQVFSPIADAQYVVEVSCGWSEKNGVQVGNVGQWHE